MTTTPTRTLLQKNISSFVKSYCSVKHMTQNEFAKSAGLSSSCLSNYMTGFRTPKLEHIDILCSALGITAAELFTEYDVVVA